MTNATAVPLSSLPQRSSAPAAGPSRTQSLKKPGLLSKSSPPSSFLARDNGANVSRASTGHTYTAADPPLSAPLPPNSRTTLPHRGNSAPQPPLILNANDEPIGPVTPTAETVSDSGSSSVSYCSTSSAPHVPFLSQLPAPDGTYLEVETRPSEYVLHIRLPGFERDAITLATKKRRILHIVADSWADTTLASSLSPQSSFKQAVDDAASFRPPRPNDSSCSESQARGGHFERRISFGYDADLLQVRAEFDGEMLRVYIPRRIVGGAYVHWT